VSGKILINYLNMTNRKTLSNIPPLQGLFLNFSIISTNIWAALPQKNAAEQQDICSEVIARISQSCIAAKY
jgi:hypothetical protein